MDAGISAAKKSKLDHGPVSYYNFFRVNISIGVNN